MIDLQTWLEKEEVPSCGHFWDLFSVLAVMRERKAETGKQRANENYSAIRTRTTRFENSLSASMSHGWPACFFHAAGAKITYEMTNAIKNPRKLL
jgi:hypothetical protein